MITFSHNGRGQRPYREKTAGRMECGQTCPLLYWMTEGTAAFGRYVAISQEGTHHGWKRLHPQALLGACLLPAHCRLSAHHVRLWPATARGTADAPGDESYRYFPGRALRLGLYRDRLAQSGRSAGPDAHRRHEAHDAAQQELW